MASATALLGLLLALCAVTTHGKARFRMDCERHTMFAIVDVTPEIERLYLHRLKGFRNCEPELRSDKAIFHVNLADINDFSTCGVTKILNKNTGEKLFYHHVVVEYTSGIKEDLRIECAFTSNGTVDQENRVRRSAQSGDVWSGFEEPEILEITSEITAVAPTPELSVTVRQDGQVVDTALNVRPGSPLDMEIYLDSASSSTYGIMVSDMIVSDTRTQEELLLTNGCSVDPYLFGNFKTETGDSLKADFRAFKFPETNNVLFKGVLNVCINKCDGVQCSNGELGYGRRRRALTPSADPNLVFQVTTTTIITVQFEDEETELKAGYVSGAEEPFAVGYVNRLSRFAGSRPKRQDVASAAAVVRASAAALLLALLVVA